MNDTQRSPVRFSIWISLLAHFSANGIIWGAFVAMEMFNLFFHHRNDLSFFWLWASEICVMRRLGQDLGETFPQSSVSYSADVM